MTSQTANAQTDKTRSIRFLLGFLASALFIGGVGAAISAHGVQAWYPQLRKPPLTPPSEVFAPIWTLLYLAVGASAWLAWRTRVSSCRAGGLRMWWVQLAVNLAWTVLFFGLHAPGFALLDILILIVAIVLTMRPFHTIRPLAAWLLAPYLVWVCFATYLNAGIWYLNR